MIQESYTLHSMVVYTVQIIFYLPLLIYSRFWRDRLVILKQAFDDAKPRTLRQAWADRRNPSQWYNFWVAGLLIIGFTLFLGTIQCVEGALQVYKAYHPT
jgi:hypothetical protein